MSTCEYNSYSPLEGVSFLFSFCDPEHFAFRKPLICDADRKCQWDLNAGGWSSISQMKVVEMRGLLEPFEDLLLL